MVLIWDKKYSFLFVEVKSRLPSNAAIGDGLTADANVDGAADDGNVFQTPKAGSNQKALSVENNVLKMLGTISSARASSVSALERLLSILENDQKQVLRSPWLMRLPKPPRSRMTIVPKLIVFGQ